jgi:hypothetical protein
MLGKMIVTTGKKRHCRVGNHCCASLHGKDIFDVRCKQHARQGPREAHDNEFSHGKISSGARQRTRASASFVARDKSLVGPTYGGSSSSFFFSSCVSSLSDHHKSPYFQTPNKMPLRLGSGVDLSGYWVDLPHPIGLACSDTIFWPRASLVLLMNPKLPGAPPSPEMEATKRTHTRVCC